MNKEYERPQHSDPEVMKKIRKDGIETCHAVLSAISENSTTQGQLTASILKNEHMAIALIAMIGVNNEIQGVGGWEGYKKWVYAELERTFNELNKPDELQAIGVGGEIIAPASPMEIN
jgi:hypothetical protein